MFPSYCSRLRKALADVGLTIASTPLVAPGRTEDACIVPARLLEDAELRIRDVGMAQPLEGRLAFLDGVQRTEVIAYAGASPLMLADAGAGIRLRSGRKFQPVVNRRALMVIGRSGSLAEAGPALGDVEQVVIDDAEPPHPLRDLELARRLVDRIRGNLELEAYDEFRNRHDDWLVVDGSLSVSSRLARDPQAVGVSKSHAALPFDGEALVRYLHLPPGHRTSLFAPGGEHAPVAAFALRLWPFAGRDLLHGLVRVELAPATASPAVADAIARWLMAERAPLPADARWDRLLYGIHSVEQHLKAAHS